MASDRHDIINLLKFTLAIFENINTFFNCWMLSYTCLQAPKHLDVQVKFLFYIIFNLPLNLDEQALLGLWFQNKGKDFILFSKIKKKALFFSSTRAK